MQEDLDGRVLARAKLRSRLADALAAAGMNKTQLATRAELGRTTVSAALSPRGDVPSAQTVAALARVLQLPVNELLEWQRLATEVPGADSCAGREPGRPIRAWEPHDLEVHPAGPSRTPADAGVLAGRVLPGYVPREHDRLLGTVVQNAAAGRSGMVVLVGGSSTGKTRACWEAVQPLASQGWRLWHPFDPTRTQAVLKELHHVGPRTVVWLNEAQHYLGDSNVGEQITAAVHRLLTDTGPGPVLVLGTLWPEYAHLYTALPIPGEPDPYSRVRELLAGRTLAVPDSFDAAALAAATALAEAGDLLLADALARAGDGRVAQDLAGAPELLRRYQQATPPARALLDAAIDARRLGVSLHLPQTFLTNASIDYLTDTDYDQLTDDWTERAFAELAQPVHGKQAPLRHAAPRPPRRPPAPAKSTAGTAIGPGAVFRLADYLEQHGRLVRRRLCPPASFWHAAHTHLTHPDDLTNLAKAAEDRHRLQWAHHLFHRAAENGSTRALFRLARQQQGEAGDGDGAEVLYRQAFGLGDASALEGWPDFLVKEERARILEGTEGREASAAIWDELAERGFVDAYNRIGQRHEEDGRRADAERFYRLGAEAGDPDAMQSLVFLLAEDRHFKEATEWTERIAAIGDIYAYSRLAYRYEAAGDLSNAKVYFQKAVDAGLIDDYGDLARLHLQEGDDVEAMRIHKEGVEAGWTRVPMLVAEDAGDHAQADEHAFTAVDHGTVQPLRELLFRRLRQDSAHAGPLARKAIDAGLARIVLGIGGRSDSEHPQANAVLQEVLSDADDVDAPDPELW
ncbi:helix-turn-helix domain-containing protein [Streptomyces sp. BYX5S]